MQIIIFGNKYQSSKSDALSSLFTELYRHGIEPDIESEFYDYLVKQLNLHPTVRNVVKIEHGTRPDADIALSIGGDGTFLRTAHSVSPWGIPILGINTGSLGYLADVTPNEIPSAVQSLLCGELIEESRTQIAVEANVELPIAETFALNEIAILKAETASMMALRTELDSNYLTTYMGDGLLVSTPTGSTAYNLSVGGPILEPQSKSYVVTPIAAHSLSMRPVVINDNSIIKVKISSRSMTYRLSIDGQSILLPTDVELTIHKAPVCTKILKQAGHNFASTLQNKLMWGLDLR